jgi:drug/metabolite transporter (DMT)-like permease
MARDRSGGRGPATLAGFGAILLWSSTVAVSRSLSEQLGPLTAGAAVFGVSGALAAATVLRHGPRRRRILGLPPRYLLVCGALFASYMMLLFLAVGRAATREQVLEVGLLNYLWPALTLLLSLVILPNRATWLLAPGTALALGGVFLVVTHGDAVTWGAFAGRLAADPGVYAMAAAAAVAWAAYSNLTRRWAGDRDDGGVAVFMPATALVLGLLAWGLDEPRAWGARSAAEALLLGAATFAGYTLWDAAMRRGDLVLVAAASYLTPLVSTIVSCLYLAVAPGARLWIGCAFLVLSSLLSRRSVAAAGGPSPSRSSP